jgi:hypothetical protein
MKQYQKSLLFSLALAMLIIVTACAPSEKSTGQIFLYGEIHGVPSILEKQLEVWHEYYHNQNMRHLFIEFAYHTAEYLNVWMLSDNDDIFYEIYHEWAEYGEIADILLLQLEFFRAIKREFPETIFHGTDILVWQNPIGEFFLQYLENNNKQDTEQYLLTLEAIEQGELYFQSDFDFEFRVTKMTENFIREFDKLRDQNVMGIYGASHTKLGYYSGTAQSTPTSEHEPLPYIPTMAQRLRERYGNSLHTEDLSRFAWENWQGLPVTTGFMVD